MTYRLIVFDFDGTLADSLPWVLSVLWDLARRHGFRAVEAGEAEALRHLDTRQTLDYLGVPLWKVPAIARDLRRMKVQAAAEIPLFAGVDDMLLGLKARGIGLGIASSDGETSIRRTLGPELAGCIGRFECGASLFGKAPRLRRLLRRASMPGPSALYVGDEMRDAAAAAKAGMSFGAVSWGYADAAALMACRPAHLFRHVDEIGRLDVSHG